MSAAFSGMENFIYICSSKKRLNQVKTKIAIVGTGGVGGFIGGLLARHYMESDEVEIYFISRGAALKSIEEKGIEIDSDEGHFFARPKVVTDDCSKIGVMDYVLFCTKAYDVEGGIRQILQCIGPGTAVIPFLNGVDSREIISRMLPANQVWYGCVYVVAYIVSPGHIKECTNGYRYMFGYPQGDVSKLNLLSGIFEKAGIRARNMEDIEIRVWDKFAFISPVATITSYTDKTYGEVLGNKVYRDYLIELLEEFKSVAAAKSKTLSKDITEAVIRQMERIPADTTTSMQRDFRAGRNTELESLTGYIVKEARRFDIEVPAYEMMYEELSKRRH